MLICVYNKNPCTTLISEKPIKQLIAKSTDLITLTYKYFHYKLSFMACEVIEAYNKIHQQLLKFEHSHTHSQYPLKANENYYDK